MDQIFTGENKQTNKQKKQVEFVTFFEVYTVPEEITRRANLRLKLYL